MENKKIVNYRMTLDSIGDDYYYGDNALAHNKNFFNKIAKKYKVNITKCVDLGGVYSVTYNGDINNLKRLFKNLYDGDGFSFKEVVKKVY